MRKGISPVVASILLVLVVLSLAGSYLVFTGRIAEETTGAAEEEASRTQELTRTLFQIKGVDGQAVLLENAGRQTIEVGSIRVTVDGNPVNYTMDGPIDPGETGRVALEALWRFSPEQHTVRITGASRSDTQQVRITPARTPITHLRFEEGSGMTAFDVSGNRNHGTLEPNETHGPEWRDGRTGGSLLFNGDTSSVSVKDDDSLDLNRFTLSAWVRYRSGTTLDQHMGIIDKKDTFDPNSANYANYQLWHATDSTRDSNAPAGSGNLRILFGDGTDYFDAYIDSNPPTGEWFHLTGTYDGTNLYIYVNGERQSDSESVSTNPRHTPEDVMGVGSHSTGDKHYFDGRLDEVLIYDRALSPDELYVLEEV